MLFFSRKEFIVAASVNFLDGLFDAIKNLMERARLHQVIFTEM